MATQIIELQDGLLIEVQADTADGPRQISGGRHRVVDGAIDTARELLLKAVEPVASVWGELNRDLSIEEVEIQLGLGFEASGRLFIAQGTGKTNLSFTLKVRPKAQA
ncbi:CU044_2847 family protein [Thiohalocapsa sp. ML1]|jgi:hypothetical protein|uniref:CU044_2847 family protein n=1 Tax=Thiohalocapsa sp. ML1 TaxID=1431688 RepID=UPI0007324324|nr:CU044_2847 family protein [Thiohalocapsa sp. ML1]